MEYKSKVKKLKALGNQKRLEILEWLLKDDYSVGQISEKINLSFKSTSKHLIRLEDAGLIERQQIIGSAFYGIKKRKIFKIIKEL